MRIECDHPGFQDNWIDVSDHWTFREFTSIGRDQTDDEYLEMLRGKATGCHIEVDPGNGEPITDLDKLTMDNLQDARMEVIGFVFNVMFTACLRLRNLGNVAARPSSNGFGNRTKTPAMSPLP